MPRRREIIRLHEDENPSCWRKFWNGLIDFLKACMPCCCFAAQKVAETAVNGATAGLASHITGPTIATTAEAGEFVAGDLLDRARSIGQAQPTDHRAITAVADAVEGVVDAAEEVGKAVVTNAADKVIGEAAKPAVHMGINRAAEGIERITDGIIAIVEHGAVRTAEVLGAVREVIREDVRAEMNLLRGIPQEGANNTEGSQPAIQVVTEEQKPAESAPASSEPDSGSLDPVGFAWAVWDELRTAAQNEINLVLRRSAAQETQSHPANVNASHHVEDSQPLVAPLPGVSQANYMATGITDSSSHLI